MPYQKLSLKEKYNYEFYFHFLLIFTIFFILFYFPSLSFAGEGGNEFADANTRVTNIIQGDGGRLAAALALGFAMIGSIFKFNMAQVASAIGVGIMATVGIGAVQAGITAII